LLAAMPRLGQQRERLMVIPGSVPAPTDWPTGCRFHDRCAYAYARCATEAPPNYPVRDDHGARCHLVVDAAPAGTRPR
jgi:oligopeptide/dipeptide ABC transporter ATP-binding protein